MSMIMNEKPKPKVGVGVIVIKDNKILLGKRKGAHGAGEWSFAGGHLEFGESVEACASRELMEETGLIARSVHLGPWVNDIMEIDRHYVTLFVFVDEFEGEPQLMEPDKCDGWNWFAWNALPSPLFLPVTSLIEKVGIQELTDVIFQQR
jgi:8-oxo-dGTP diphosphatase